MLSLVIISAINVVTVMKEVGNATETTHIRLNLFLQCIIIVILYNIATHSLKIAIPSLGHDRLPYRSHIIIYIVKNLVTGHFFISEKLLNWYGNYRTIIMLRN